MADELKPGTNTGVTEVAPPPLGWVAGGETGVKKQVLEPGANYDLYLPDEEAQAVWSPFVFDSSGCVTFSALNCVETVINRMRAKALMPVTHEKFLQDHGYINKQSGKINLSDRYNAKLSGTTVAGNSLGNVGESIRYLHGVIPEGDWPFPVFTAEENADGQKKWDKYYAPIPQNLQNKGRKFLEYFEITYEWNAVGSSTPAKLREDLKYGPFQIAASVCSPWSSNEGMPPIPACGCTAQHATMVYGFRDDLAFKDFDHYKSFRKLLAENYCIQWGVQYFVRPIQPIGTEPFKYTFNINLKFGDVGTEVHNLQRALQFLRRKDGKPYMNVGVFGPFGPQTRTALAIFQQEHNIPDPPVPGTNFGPKGRAAMNQRLNA